MKKIIEYTCVNLNVLPSKQEIPLLHIVARSEKHEILGYLITVPGIDVNIRDEVNYCFRRYVQYLI